jgi:pentatricopeptide repeat protein
MYYLHESRKFADILAVFDANFDAMFLPAVPWRVLRDAATPAEPRRAAHVVPKKMKISGADAWLIWDALVRLSVSVVADPHALPLLQELHYSAVHFSAQLTGRQFRAFPTSYTAVFRSIVWAYGELGEIDKAVAAAGDMDMIGKLDVASIGVFDELAGVHARARNVPAATQLLESLEELGPRLATYGVMMDAYMQAGLVDEALKLEIRMKQKCEYVPGQNWRMDATVNALRAFEEALDPESVCSKFASTSGRILTCALSRPNIHSRSR